MSYNITKSTKNIVTASIIAVGALIAASSTNAYAQNYDGYCYQKNDNTRTTGTVIGAIAGAVLGSNIAGHGNKTSATVTGAVVGGVAGSQIGGQIKSTNKAKCLGNNYYRYDSGYYEPPAPPAGYRVAFFNQRPRGIHVKQDVRHHNEMNMNRDDHHMNGDMHNGDMHNMDHR